MGENLSPGRRGRRTALGAAVIAALAVFAGLIAGRDRLEEQWLLWRLRSSDPAVRQGALERLGERGRAGVLGTIVADEARSFPARLRDAGRVARVMLGGREWSEAERVVLAEGWIPLETGRLEYFDRHLFILPRNAAIAPGGFRHQVHCAVHVDRGVPRPAPSAGPGRVENVEVRLVADFKRPYDEVMARNPYPEGSLPVLVLDEVRHYAARFPVLKKVEIFCGRSGYVSEEESPLRTFVSVELEVDRQKKIGEKSFLFGAAMKDPSGGELFGPLESFGGSEGWHGDPQQVEENRAKYGAGAQ